jgi:hypothetical protein
LDLTAELPGLGARALESVGLKVKEMAKENKSVGAGKKF